MSAIKTMFHSSIIAQHEIEMIEDRCNDDSVALLYKLMNTIVNLEKEIAVMKNPGLAEARRKDLTYMMTPNPRTSRVEYIS